MSHISATVLYYIIHMTDRVCYHVFKCRHSFILYITYVYITDKKSGGDGGGGGLAKSHRFRWELTMRWCVVCACVVRACVVCVGMAGCGGEPHLRHSFIIQYNIIQYNIHIKSGVDGRGWW